MKLVGSLFVILVIYGALYRVHASILDEFSSKFRLEESAEPVSRPANAEPKRVIDMIPDWLMSKKVTEPSGNQEMEIPNKEENLNLNNEIQQRIIWVRDPNSWRGIHKIILQMEGALDFKSELNEHPFTLHGLLSTSLEGMKLRNRDTSFGFYGFTLDTFATSLSNTSIDVKHISDPSQSGSIKKVYSEEIDMLRVQARDLGLYIPHSQTLAFVVLILSYDGLLHNGKVIEKTLSKDEVRLIDQIEGFHDLSEADKAEFISVCHFYRFYNGSLQDYDAAQRKFSKYTLFKLKRLFEYYKGQKDEITLSALVSNPDDVIHRTEEIFQLDNAVPSKGGTNV